MLFSALSSRAELHVDMKAKVSGSIEAQSREISRHNAVYAIEKGDFSTLWRLCIESPSQPKLASSLHNKRLSYWRLTGCCRNDNEAALAISAASFCYCSFIPSLIFFTASLERPVPFDTSSTDKPMERKRIAV